MDFQNLMKIEYHSRLVFKILIFHKPSLRSYEAHTKFGLDRFCRFDVFWIRTNRRPDTDMSTDKQFMYKNCAEKHLS